MGAAVAKTGSAVLFDTYAQKTAQRLQVTSDAVRTEFRQLARRSAASPRERTAAPDPSAQTEVAPAPAARPSAQEFWLLKLLLLEEELHDWTRRNLDTAWIRHPGVRRMIEARLVEGPENTVSVAAWIGTLESPEDRSFASEALADRRDIPNRGQQILDLVRRLRDQHADREIAGLNRELSQDGLPEERKTECVRRLEELRDLKPQPLPPLTSPPTGG
jgi:DNA primase